MRRAMQFIQRCDSSCFMGKGGPHAVSEIGKRSIFKICGRCFGDSLCYKREIVYERLRYSIFMTWIANSVDSAYGTPER